jgi:glutathione S-transferase
MRLWYRPGTAAMAPHAALAEIGCDYELVRVGFGEPAAATPDYLRLNPAGRVPTLEDGGLVLTEAAAIMLHLADRFPDARLAPAPGTDGRADVYRWLAYLTNTLQPSFMRFFYPERYVGGAAAGALAAGEARQLSEQFDRLDAELAEREWIAGGGRSAADLFLFMLVRWGRRLDRPAWDRPALRAYWLRLLDRPGVRRMMDEQGLELPAL